MHPVLQNILGLILGILIGSLVNGWIITISGNIIPPPEGADLTTPEGLIQAMAIMQPKHFVMPFLAHAIGTLVGAFIAAKIAATHKRTFALVVGVVFLIGGIYMVTILPSPLWFNVLDLAVAYIPMAYIGWLLATTKSRKQS
ncbi:MAG TPA: hypothetical protein VIK71_07995 [Flavobacteriales bacterium]